MSERHAKLRPQPVPDGFGGHIYVYRTQALHPDLSAWLDRYSAYSKPYPQGDSLGAALTVGRVIRKARRAAARIAHLAEPVDVSAYTEDGR